MTSTPPPVGARHAARDFAAEELWLKRLPLGPDTDRRQDEWENDPYVKLWRAQVEYDRALKRSREELGL